MKVCVPSMMITSRPGIFGLMRPTPVWSSLISPDPARYCALIGSDYGVAPYKPSFHSGFIELWDLCSEYSTLLGVRVVTRETARREIVVLFTDRLSVIIKLYHALQTSTQNKRTTGFFGLFLS